MSHNICAYNQIDDPTEEIAYLNRSAFNPLNIVIYEALDAKSHHCGSSGCGYKPKHFTTDILKKALAEIPDEEEYAPEREFLADCISHGKNGVWISFC